MNSSDSSAHQSLGYLLGGPLGRPGDAIFEMQSALELDPLSPSKRNSLGLAFYWARRDDEAIDVLRQIPDGDENTERRHRRLAEIFERKGMERQAKLELLRALETVEPQRAAESRRQCDSSAYAQCKKTVLLLDASESQRRAKTDALRIARDFARLTNKDESFKWLEKAVGEHEQGVMFLSVDRDWDSLRSDPRFSRVA